MRTAFGFFKNFRAANVFLAVFFLFTALTPSAQAEEVKLSGKYSQAAVTTDTAVSINILVQIEAPVIKPKETRPPVAVSLVIDRSGSMSEEKKLTYAIQASKTLVRSLNENDTLGIVAYSTEVEELRPLSKVTDKEKIMALLDSLTPTNYTNLSGGLEKGIAQLAASKSASGTVRRVILLSDDLANRGVTNGEHVAKIGANAYRKSISVSCIGLGLDYDENLMQLLAQRGGGQYYYVKDSEDLPAVFRQELSLATEIVTQKLKLQFEPLAWVKDIKVYGYSINKNGNYTEIESADLSSGEKRQIMLRLNLDPKLAKDASPIGHIRLTYKDKDSDKEQSVLLPLQVELVKDQTAADAANAKAQDSIKAVREEALLLDAEEAHVTAMQALEEGDAAKAKDILQKNQRILADAPAPSAAMLNKQEQLKEAEAQLEQASTDDALQKSMSKASKSSYYMSAKGNKQGVMLQKGDSGVMVEKLQKALKDKGFYKNNLNGQYDAALEEAVKAFQKSAGLTEDGVAGQSTLKSLGGF